jgi:hypothetical protein
MMGFCKRSITSGTHALTLIMDARVKPAHDAEFLARAVRHRFDCQTAAQTSVIARII